MSDAFMFDQFPDKWDHFCDGEQGDASFIDSAEALGLVQLMPVKREHLEDAFAAERGIEKGGYVWELTKAGRIRYEARPI